MPLSKLIGYTSLASLAIMGIFTQASISYAKDHPQDGMHLKMMYCMEMQREENRSPEDVGCKMGHGIGKVGVKRDIVEKLVERIRINPQSYEYKQLVSLEGLHMTFIDPALGSKGKVIVWMNPNTKETRINVCREE